MTGRTDLLEQELTELKRKAQKVLNSEGTTMVWSVSKIDADRILRLTGEVVELRNRESHARQMHDLEGEY